jgi:hypothetical protein
MAVAKLTGPVPKKSNPELMANSNLGLFELSLS